MPYEITGEPKHGGYIDRVELRLIESLPQGPLTVFDVGANIGDFTQAVLERRPEARVFAFEPLPQCQLDLQNRFGSRIVIAGALGDKSSPRGLYTDGPVSQLGTFYPRDWIEQLKMDLVGEVLVTTLQNVCEQYEIDHIDYIKLDCEGHEYNVLVGAGLMLNNIDLISWELLGGPNKYANGITLKDFELLLSEHFTIENTTPESGTEGACIYAARKKNV